MQAYFYLSRPFVQHPSQLLSSGCEALWQIKRALRLMVAATPRWLVDGGLFMKAGEHSQGQKGEWGTPEGYGYVCPTPDSRLTSFCKS